MDNNFITADQIFKNGRNSIIEKDVAGIPLLVVPKDMQTVTLDHIIDQRAERPRTLTQQVEALSIDSFLDYYNRYADENSTIFADTENCTFVGVIDYHQSPSEPRWKNHTVIYKGPLTSEWNDWIEHNDTPMSQVDFALFIENHMRQFNEPTGGNMLTIARTLKTKSEVEFESGINLHDGQVQFKYIETLRGQAGGGEFSIPEEFTLGLRIFQNEAPWKISARFRYRKSAAGLSMWYTLQQPDISKEDATAEMYDKIEKGIAKGKGHIIKGRQ